MSAKPWTFRQLREGFRGGFSRRDFKLIDGTPYLLDDLATCDSPFCCDPKVHQDDLDDDGLCLQCTRDPYHTAPKCSRVDNG